jgi:F-type H+-transporting ATPase subunit epsilon
MAGTFQLEIATAERLLVNEQVTQAEIPGKEGYMGILAGHAPLLSTLGAGVLSYDGGRGSEVLSVAGGFIEVFGDHVSVLADDAWFAADIQTDKARRELEQANEALRKAQNESEADAALKALQRAQAYLDAAARAPGRAHGDVSAATSR